MFIDSDLAEAARGGEIFSFIEDPFNKHLDADKWQNSLGSLGAELAALRCRLDKFPPAKVKVALRRIQTDSGLRTLCADLFLVLNAMGLSYDGPEINIKDAVIPEIHFESKSANFSSVRFQECIFRRLDLPSGTEMVRLPSFLECHFGVVEGCAGMDDLPNAFVDCTVDEFEYSAQNTQSILDLSLPLGAKVVLTILRKIYVQSGSGRKESALFRGLDAHAQELVPDALDLLRNEHFIARGRQKDDVVWLPTKLSDARRRALSMLAAPTKSKDPIMIRSRGLG